MHNRFRNTLFASQTPLSLTTDLKETIEYLFTSQKSLRPNLVQLFNKPNHIPTIKLLGAMFGVAFLIRITAFYLDMHNRDPNELLEQPGDIRENEDFMHFFHRRVLPPLFIVLSIAVFLFVDRFINQMHRNPRLTNHHDERYVAVQNRMHELLIQLENDFDNLPATVQRELQEDYQRFTCPISRGLMRNPVAVWIDQRSSTGKVEKTAKLYDYESFINDAAHQLRLKDFISEQVTYLRVQSVTFSPTINQEYRAFLEKLSDKVNEFKLTSAQFVK